MDTGGAWYVCEERVQPQTIIQNVEGIVHGYRRVLLEVFPALAPRFRAGLDTSLTALAEDVCTYSSCVGSKEPLTMHQAHEVSLV